MKPEIRSEVYFDGPRQSLLSHISGSVIDEVISLLSLKPDDPAEGIGSGTIKECLWKEVAFSIYAWDKPTPSALGATPKDLKEHSNKARNTINKALDTLKGMEYASVFSLPNLTLDKKFIFAKKVRRISSPDAVYRLPKATISDHKILENFKANGVWGKYFPFDEELQDAINALQKIIPYFDEAEIYFKEAVPGRGERKAGKDNADNLIHSLCDIYRKFTGKIPKANHAGDSTSEHPGSVTGDVVHFLKIILIHTNYNQEITETALEKRIRELQKIDKYKRPWE